MDDFELEHQLDEIAAFNHNKHIMHTGTSNHGNKSKAGHQQYYSTHINISQRNSMIPASSPTMGNCQSESVVKEWNRKRSKTMGMKKKQHAKNGMNKRKSRSLKRNANPNGQYMINGQNNVHFNCNDLQLGIYNSAPDPALASTSSQHRNLGSLTHTELKGFLEANNYLFNYNGYNNPNIVQ